MADWKKLKKEYVAGGCSYRSLSAKYGVPFGSLRRVAAKEHWTDLRAQAEAKADTDIVEAVGKQNGKMGKEIYAAADLLLRKLLEAVEADEAITAQSMRQYTAALRDLKEIKNIRSQGDIDEQSARIAKLRKDAESDEQKNEGIRIEFSADLEEYAR